MSANLFKRGSKKGSPLSPAANAQFISNPNTFTDEPMQLYADSDSLVSRALARSATIPGLASPHQNSDHHQIVPYRSNGGSVGYTDVLDDDEPTFPMHHRAGESRSRNRAQTPTDRRTGGSATQMQSPSEQPYGRGTAVRPLTQMDFIHFARRFAAAIPPNSWGSHAFTVAITIMEAIVGTCLNEDITNDLMSKSRAFFYVLSQLQDNEVPPDALETFNESLDGLETLSEGAMAKIARAVNPNDIRKQIELIKKGLNNAIQQLQTALQLPVIVHLDQISSSDVDQWIDECMKDPRVHVSPDEKIIKDATFVTHQAFRTSLITNGHAKSSMLRATVNSKRDFRSYTQGNTLQETWDGGRYESDGDMFIDTIATSGLSNWQQNIPRW